MPAFGPPLLNAGDAINDRLLLFLPGTEDGGGLTNDLSPRRANGTLVNSPSRVSGALAKAIRLNGSNQYISTAAGQSIPGGFSATARVKLDAAAAYDNSILSSILGVDQTILWNVTAYGTILQFWATTSSGQATATGFPSILGREADLGVSWAPGRTTRFYVDGNYVGGGSTAGDIQTAITGWNVGRYGVPGIWYFPGDVQLVRAWARVLPDSDFRRLSADPWAGTAQRRRLPVRSGAAGYTLDAEPLAYEYAAGTVGLSSARRISVSPLAYNYAPQDVGLSYRQGAHTLDVEPLGYGYRPASVDLAYSGAVASAGPSRTRRGARRVYLPEPQASAVFHPNALPEDLAPHAVKAWQDDEDDEWFLLA